MLGAMLLLLLTGLETDLSFIRRQARTAISVSLGGFVVPFLSGILLGYYLPAELHGPNANPVVLALFVGTALSISAIPVIAKVLFDLQLIRRDIGQTIIAAGMTDDTVAWILLSVVASLAAGEAVTAESVGWSIGKVALFFGCAFTLGRMALERLFPLVQDHAVSRERVLSLIVAAMFAFGAVAQALGLEAVLGAFVVGMLFGQMRRLSSDVVHRIESIVLGIFAPIFFGVAGLKVDARALASPKLLGIAALVIFTASFGKWVGCYIGARYLGKQSHWKALAFGAGLNARGAMEILIATVGLRLGILSPELFSSIVIMAIVTSLMAPPALRWCMRHIGHDDDEHKRLLQREQMESSRLRNMRRVLVPVRTRADGLADTQSLESVLLKQIDPELFVTLFTVASESDKARSQTYLAELRKLFVQRDTVVRVAHAEDPASAIIEEAGRGYDLVMLGATESAPGSDTVFNAVVDRVVRTAGGLTMVIRATNVAAHLPLRRILVPSNGSAASREAAELAFLLARDTRAEVTVVHVVERSEAYFPGEDNKFRERQLEAAYQSIQSLQELGETIGVEVEATVRRGTTVEQEILELARSRDYDLLILGTSLKVGTSRLFLGPRVERMISESTCPVILLNG
jgi:Kef-type K+ transport system membrane component KefB/nucleotide-binding universal stress UspA family protein